MFEILAILAGIIVVILLIPYLVWRWTFGGQLRNVIIQFFNQLHEKETRVDPEKPITPSERERISEQFKHYAEHVKQQTAPDTGAIPQRHSVPQADIAATTSDQKPIYEPPYTQNADTIEAQTQSQSTQAQQNPIIDEPVQPLVEDDTFKVDDPVIDDQHIDPETASADSLDVQIPESDSSPYGVRSAEYSPGRRLRDKRYRRNAS